MKDFETINIHGLETITGGVAQGIRPPFIGGVKGSDVDLPRNPPALGIRPPFLGGVKGSDVALPKPGILCKCFLR
jgi:hypothetical protein